MLDFKGVSEFCSRYVFEKFKGEELFESVCPSVFLRFCVSCRFFAISYPNYLNYSNFWRNSP